MGAGTADVSVSQLPTATLTIPEVARAAIRRPCSLCHGPESAPFRALGKRQQANWPTCRPKTVDEPIEAQFAGLRTSPRRPPTTLNEEQGQLIAATSPGGTSHARTEALREVVAGTRRLELNRRSSTYGTRANVIGDFFATRCCYWDPQGDPENGRLDRSEK